MCLRSFLVGIEIIKKGVIKIKYNIIGKNNYNSDNLLYEILINRNVKDIDKFLNVNESVLTNPHDYKNMDDAAHLLVEHLDKGSGIAIVVDSDVDGLTSASLMNNYIKEVSPETKVYYVNHSSKSHGIIMEEFSEVLPKIKLLIVPDGGSENFKEHKLLKEQGIDTIILDHHPVTKYSTNAIVVNNNIGRKNSKVNRNLSGVGIVYKFCKVLDEILWVESADKYLDLVALGLIADSMETLDLEIQYFLRKGLSKINSPMFQALVDIQDFSTKGEINPMAISFYIAPLINSVFRLGTLEEKDLMFEAFSNINSDKTYIYIPTRGKNKGEKLEESLYEHVARMCLSYNGKRKRLSKKILDTGIDFPDNKVICKQVESDQASMSGVLANTLLNSYKKPALVYYISDNGEINGSMRANTGDFKDKLNSTDFFTFVKGHQDASGIQIKKEYLDKISNELNNFFKDEVFEKSYNVDFVIPFEEVSFDFIKDLYDIREYYSKSIQEPLIVIGGIIVPVESISLIGAKKSTIKIETDELDFITFKANEDMYYDLTDGKTEVVLNVLGRGSINEYDGKITAQIIMEDFRVVE